MHALREGDLIETCAIFKTPCPCSRKALFNANLDVVLWQPGPMIEQPQEN